MSREFKCERCGLSLGEMSQGKLRLKSVLLCRDCWKVAKIAIDIAETAREATPDFIKGLLNNVDAGVKGKT